MNPSHLSDIVAGLCLDPTNSEHMALAKQVNAADVLIDRGVVWDRTAAFERFAGLI
jgi:hypothetical protein